ncbi:retrovirus-related pol polyprotein from transposon TNT 1-94 [Tanacetum coccineum]
MLGKGGNYKKIAASASSGSSSFTFTYEQFETLMRSVINDIKNNRTAGNDCTDDELDFVAGMLYLSATTNTTLYYWILDTSATDHMTPHSKSMLSAKILKNMPEITLPNGKSSVIIQTGQVKLNNGIVLKDDLTTKKVLGLGKKLAGLYHLLNVAVESVDAKLSNMLNSHVNSGLFSCSAGVYNNSVYPNKFSLWHHRLGHLSISRMKYIQSTDVSVNASNDATCLTCPMAKLTKLPYSLSDSHSSDAFHLIHMDTQGPYKVPTNGKYKYFLTIMDDYSRATWTYLMIHKSYTFDVLKTFLKFVEIQFDTKVKCVRSDHALEFVKGPCADFLTKQGIKHQTTWVDRPQQNGRVERKHRHILEVARALRFQSSLPLRF